MKISLKYGLSITAGVIVWVSTVHLLVPNPQSKLHSLGAFLFFNLLQFAMTSLGIRAVGCGSKPTFKKALKTGVSISFVYAVSSSLFFLCAILLFGSPFIASEPSAAVLPKWLVLVQAFSGLFLGAMLFGLVYSTLISFMLAKRRSEAA